MAKKSKMEVYYIDYTTNKIYNKEDYIKIASERYANEWNNNLTDLAIEMKEDGYKMERYIKDGLKEMWADWGKIDEDWELEYHLNNGAELVK